jgi:type IV fimbrial biogenesis protein FimT
MMSKLADQSVCICLTFRVKRSRGFTLIEWLVVITIMAILAAFATPGFQDMVLRNRVISGTGEFVSALTLARSEAILRRGAVAVCPVDAAGGMAKGWRVREGKECDASDPVLFSRPEPLKKVVLCEAADCGSLASGAFVFNPMGVLEGGVTPVFLCIDEGSGTVGREIHVSGAGRVKTRPVDCS